MAHEGGDADDVLVERNPELGVVLVVEKRDHVRQKDVVCCKVE